MDFLKEQELLIRKPSSKESQIDYITYDPQRHVLCVGMNRQKFSYMGVPDSVYFHLALIENPDHVFMTQIFNRYPVVIEQEKVSETVRKRRRRFSKSLLKKSASPTDDDSDFD